MQSNPNCFSNCIKDTIEAGLCWCFQQGIHPENDQPADTWDESTETDPEETETPDDWENENKGCLLIESDGSKHRIF